MDLTLEAKALKDVLGKNVQHVAILMPETAGRDVVAAGLSLFLTLQQMEKTAKIAHPKPPTVGWSHLIGINKMVSHIGSKNFVISLDYVEGAIEKVSYNIENDKFNLVIEPRHDAPLFNEKNVKYRYDGLAADLIITLNAQSLEQLGKYYEDHKKLFQEKPVVVIDHNAANKQYGAVNIIRPASSISEIVSHILKTVQLPVNSDIATNLYDGILSGSRNFTLPTVTASTFEAAAWVLHQGARKQAAAFAPARSEELPRQEFAGSDEDGEEELPPDWLKPKIYKGSSLL